MTETRRLTVAQAIVRWLIAQRTVEHRNPGGSVEGPLFPGVFAIFGHGNVTCLGQALQEARSELPTWRGQNEQGMALAGVAYAKAKRRRQVMVVTSSIGPGALNMVTAAGVALANRLPLLLLSGDTFLSRVPDPVLQQVEHPGAPGTTVNDAFRPVVRFWDRIVRPEQLLRTLPGALQTMLDPAQCGPAFIALPQDVQGMSWDVPAEFLSPVVHAIPRPRPDRDQVHRAVEAIRASRRPLLVAGGGVRYSGSEAALSSFADRHRIPVVETMAGRSTLLAEDPAWAGPLGITGWDAANRLAGEADLILAVGTRLQDFTTASWTLFGPEGVPLIGVNVSGFDAMKHASQVVVGDALACLEDLGAALGEWAAPAAWQERAGRGRDEALSLVGERTALGPGMPTYAQVVGAVNRAAGPEDLVLTAAGGLPGELNGNWLAKGVGTFDCEYGFSCMGYEISGAWGAAMARRAGDVFCLVGDGSYLMLNSDLLSSVLSGHPMIVVVCDNGGFAVIDRLQRAQGGVSFATMLEESRGPDPATARVDFAAHARALGCDAEEVSTIGELEEALARARSPKRTTVLVLRTDPGAWTENDAFWEVGIPEQSDRAEVRAARERMRQGRLRQWLG